MPRGEHFKKKKVETVEENFEKTNLDAVVEEKEAVKEPVIINKLRPNEIPIEINLNTTEDQELTLGLPDRSKFNEADKIQCLINIFKQFPPQYLSDEKKAKETVWAVGRFEPTNAMMNEARKRINDSIRN